MLAASERQKREPRAEAPLGLRRFRDGFGIAKSDGSMAS